MVHLIKKTPRLSIGAWANQGFEALHQDNQCVFERASSKRGGQNEQSSSWSAQLIQEKYRSYTITNKRRDTVMVPNHLRTFLKFDQPK